MAMTTTGMWEFKRNNTFLVVFVLLTITYMVLAIANFASLAGLTVLGGYLGILTALAAWYASAKGIFAATLVSKK